MQLVTRSISQKPSPLQVAVLAIALACSPALSQDRKEKQESANQKSKDCWQAAADGSAEEQKKAKEDQKKGDTANANEHLDKAFLYELQGAACTMALALGVAAVGAMMAGAAAAAAGGGGDEPPPLPQDNLEQKSIEEIRESVRNQVVDLSEEDVPNHQFQEELAADLKLITEMIQEDP